ncbi:MAG: hypothetical protein QXX08_09880 [Candidatus Bathyarchaeia archaeon]
MTPVEESSTSLEKLVLKGITDADRDIGKNSRATGYDLEKEGMADSTDRNRWTPHPNILRFLQ